MTFKDRHDEAARISAYAFGELEGDELAAMQAAEAADPLLARRVAELRAFGEEIGATLKDEPMPPLASLATDEVIADFAAPSRGRLLRFPAWAWAATGLAAAAGVAVMFLLRESETRSGQGEREGVVAKPALVETKESPSVPIAATEAPSAPGAVEPLAVESVAEVVSGDVPLAMDGEEGVKEAAVIARNPEIPPVGPAEKVAGETETSSAIKVAVAAAPPTPASDTGAPMDVRMMLNKGRSRYAADDLDAAAAFFDAVKKIDAGNREAGYFSARIDQDRARGGGKTSSVTRRFGTTVASARRVVAGATSLVRTERPEGNPAIAEADFVTARSEPVSTFSIDVDTGGYSEIRRSIQGFRRLPAPDTVRIEEMVNYFPYRYEPPSATPGMDAAEPFATHLAVASAPWAPDHRLVRIAIKGREIPSAERPPANLVFLVDTSGSMTRSLALVKFSLRELLGRLRPDDHVAIVTFETETKVELPSTPAERGDEIRAAIDRLHPGKGTNGSGGIQLAYRVAKESFQAEGVNRVILCTDGEFNIGATDRDSLLSLIRESARSRVYLTVLGFGMQMRLQLQRLPASLRMAASMRGSRDEMLEMLADNGNGVYGFVDSTREARKILVDQVEGTLAAIAKDVKIQVRFNPARVESYRLVGYENRALENRDFDDDRVDAGEIGAGHTMTALYEIVPTSKGRARKGKTSPAGGGGTDELLALEIRYEIPEGETRRTLNAGLIDEGADFESADADFQFAAAVAAWGMLLREGGRANQISFTDVQRWAEAGLADDPAGYRAEFLELVRRSRTLNRDARPTFP